MPTAQVISDIHFENHSDDGETFFSTCFDSDNADLLILAGDIVEYWGIQKYLSIFSKHYKDVLYVLGNHEYYGSSFGDVFDIIKSNNIPSNVRVLYRDSCTIEGQKFIGCTLWFPNDTETMKHKHRLNDFRYIKDYEPRVFEENRQDIDYIQQQTDEQSIVITHHLPTTKAIPQRFEGSPLTGFFVCDMLPYHVHPKIWVFGHTHWHVDVTDEKGTRFLANPYGDILHSGFQKQCLFLF